MSVRSSDVVLVGRDASREESDLADWHPAMLAVPDQWVLKHPAPHRTRGR